jgi:hypothetical protein
MIANVADGVAARIEAILSVMLLFQVINNVRFVFKQAQNICAKVCTQKVLFSTVNKCMMCNY